MMFKDKKIETEQTGEKLSQSFSPLDTARNMNVHKTFRRCSVYFLNVLVTFNYALRPGVTRSLKLQETRSAKNEVTKQFQRSHNIMSDNHVKNAHTISPQ